MSYVHDVILFRESFMANKNSKHLLIKKLILKDYQQEKLFRWKKTSRDNDTEKLCEITLKKWLLEKITMTESKPYWSLMTHFVVISEDVEV